MNSALPDIDVFMNMESKFWIMDYENNKIKPILSFYRLAITL